MIWISHFASHFVLIHIFQGLAFDLHRTLAERLGPWGRLTARLPRGESHTSPPRPLPTSAWILYHCCPANAAINKHQLEEKCLHFTPPTLKHVKHFKRSTYSKMPFVKGSSQLLTLFEDITSDHIKPILCNGRAPSTVGSGTSPWCNFASLESPFIRQHGPSQDITSMLASKLEISIHIVPRHLNSAWSSTASRPCTDAERRDELADSPVINDQRMKVVSYLFWSFL